MNSPEGFIESNEETGLDQQNIYSSIEEYKQFLADQKAEQEELKKKAERGAAILEQRRRKNFLKEIQKNKVCDCLCIKEEPEDPNSCDKENQQKINDGNLCTRNSGQVNDRKVTFVIETNGNIEKMTKDFLSSLGENSSSFKMKVNVGNFKIEIGNDS